MPKSQEQSIAEFRAAVEAYKKRLANYDPEKDRLDRESTLQQIAARKIAIARSIAQLKAEEQRKREIDESYGVVPPPLGKRAMQGEQGYDPSLRQPALPDTLNILESKVPSSNPLSTYAKMYPPQERVNLSDRERALQRVANQAYQSDMGIDTPYPGSAVARSDSLSLGLNKPTGGKFDIFGSVSGGGDGIPSKSTLEMYDAYINAPEKTPEGVLSTLGERGARRGAEYAGISARAKQAQRTIADRQRELRGEEYDLTQKLSETKTTLGTDLSGEKKNIDFTDKDAAGNINLMPDEQTKSFLYPKDDPERKRLEAQRETVRDSLNVADNILGMGARAVDNWADRVGQYAKIQGDTLAALDDFERMLQLYEKDVAEKMFMDAYGKNPKDVYSRAIQYKWIDGKNTVNRR